jgi:hypothetical protein
LGFPNYTRRLKLGAMGTESPAKVFEFLTAHRGESFCDGCIANATGVDRGEAYTITATLALFPEQFTKLRGMCRCSTRELWISAAR